MKKARVLEVASEYIRKAIETRQEEFVIICPKCGYARVTFGGTNDGGYIYRCINSDCRHKYEF